MRRRRHIHLLILTLMFAAVGAACTVTERDAASGAAATPTGDDAASSPTPGAHADPTVTGTSTPDIEPSPSLSPGDDYRDLEPPPIRLRTPGGGVQEGGLGAYCWDFPEQGIAGQVIGQCVDTDVVILPEDPVEVDAGDTVEFDLTGLDTDLESLTYDVYRAEGNVETDRQGWPMPVLPYRADDPVESGDLELEDRVSFGLDQPAGEYAIKLSLYGDRGDMQQGFLVRLSGPDAAK